MVTPRPFAAFDIDGTLIRWQLYHAVTDMLARQNLLDPVIYNELKSARMDWKRRSSPDAFRAYESRVVAAYERAILDLTATQFEEVAKAVFDEYKDQVYRYTRDLIRELKEKNYLLFAISGSQTEIVALIAEYYGFDDFVGTTYEQEQGRYTGNVTLHKDRKHIILNEMIERHNATSKGSIAVGDSEGDITMLQAVERPIAFNPTQKLYDIAREHTWPIIVERKNVIYNLEHSDDRYILA